ncbi:DUF6624 domain-containing protein [Streptomyces sp. G45]|uniref:DUF6624 domain-containing protein n=1 Tax=Streptomyces sp. G45 TaxID=3406627 RepID=UPI003C281CF4
MWPAACWTARRRRAPAAPGSRAGCSVGGEISRGRQLEHANAQVLQRVIADHGWPGLDLVRAEGAKAAWWLVPHADHLPDLQRLLHAAAEQGQDTRGQRAHLHARCHIRAGTAQTYGTQDQPGPHGIEPCPARAPAGLGARRAEAGLPRLPWR